MKKILISFALLSFFSDMAYASPTDYKKYYEVDLDAPVPDLAALARELDEKTDNYDPKYILSWDMGITFNPEISGIITAYGTTEKRIKKATDDTLYEQIASLPKEYYPYIGPNLHTLQGIPEKVLNMPGIKETKNQFPKIIAPQLQDIEDLEFLSPNLYILLMPQMWPSNQKPVEHPRRQKVNAGKVTYDADFYEKVLSKIPDQGFGGASRSGETPLPDRLRTLNPDKNSALTTADIKAFLNTLDGVKKFSTLENYIKILQAGALLDYWEQKNGENLMVNGLKDVVNPCQRLALKIKWAGMENEFMMVVAPQGFNLKEWAYTCDKTIKAYRVAHIPMAYVTTIAAFKKGLLDTYFKTMNPKWRDKNYATLQSLSEMYNAPEADVFEALKNEAEIKEKLKPLGGSLITSPLAN